MRSKILSAIAILAIPMMGMAQQQPASILVTNRGGNVAYGLLNSVGGTAMGVIFNPPTANTWSLGYANNMNSAGTSVFSWSTSGVSLSGTAAITGNSTVTGDVGITGDVSVSGTFDVSTSSTVMNVTDKLGIKVSTASTSSQSLCLIGAVDALPTAGYSKNCLAVLTSDNALYISTEAPVGAVSWIKVGAQ